MGFLGSYIFHLADVLFNDLCLLFAIEATQVLKPFDGLFVMVIGGLGMVAPVQGGIGAYHLVVKIGLMILGISNDAALLFATVVHTCQTLMTLFCRKRFSINAIFI